MNYLGHALLSMGDPNLLAGNMIGDYVKGSAALDDYPEGIRRGITLHRKIDSFADSNDAALRARVWFREKYGLYSGAIIDTIFDHYIATDPQFFKTEGDLLSFSQDVYKKLEAYKNIFPPQFAKMFPYMKEQNWLYNYRTMTGVSRALSGLHRRAKYMEEPNEAYQTFVIRYYELAQSYYDFMEKAYKYVKSELTE